MVTRKGTTSNETMPVWVKTEYSDKPSLVQCKCSWMVAEFLQHLLLLHLMEGKASNLVLRHKGCTVAHDFLMKNMSGITLQSPVTVEQEDDCKYFLNMVILYCISQLRCYWIHLWSHQVATTNRNIFITWYQKPMIIHILWKLLKVDIQT